MKKLAINVFLILCLSFGIAYQLLSHYLNKPLTIADSEITFVIESGSSLNKVVRQLEKEGVLENPLFLRLYARAAGKTLVHAGEYRLTAQLTPATLLDALNRGSVIQRQVTFVEGKTFRAALAALHKSDKLQKTLEGLSDAELISRLNTEEAHLEGLFFPDTYQYTARMSDKDILHTAYQRMKTVLAEEWEGRDSNLPYKNPYEALIMASIIEKETGVAEERSAIAGVFVRRLQKGMRLQTDPTVIYGLGDSYQGNITRKHLLQDTPYNTYTRSGLPPTPIALAGREAIHAALHPQSGDSLFFVGMGDGHHYFSATLAEHEKAVREYQLSGRKKDYRSAPPATSK